MGWCTTHDVKVAVARRRDGSDGVALGTVATARNGYLPRLSTQCPNYFLWPRTS